MPAANAYVQLAENTARRITHSHTEWTGFLKTAARLYKYPYHEQLMIYAQRPEATACADYRVWNDRMRRYIRRGSKGIALLDVSGDEPKLRYVFDIADTGTRAASRPFSQWQLSNLCSCCFLLLLKVFQMLAYREQAFFYPGQGIVNAQDVAAWIAAQGNRVRHCAFERQQILLSKIVQRKAHAKAAVLPNDHSLHVCYALARRKDRFACFFLFRKRMPADRHANKAFLGQRVLVAQCDIRFKPRRLCLAFLNLRREVFQQPILHILLRDGCAAWNRLFFLRQVPPLRDQGVDAPGDLRPFQQHIRASRFLQAYAFGVMFFMASRNARKRMGMTSYPVFIFKKIRLFLIRMGLREERGDAASPVLYAASAGKLSICFIPCDKSLQSGRFQQRGFVFLSRPIQLAQPFQQSHRLMIPIRKQVGVL